MNTTGLLGSLAQKGIELYTVNGELRYRAPQGALDPALKAEIVARKGELVTALSGGTPRKTVRDIAVIGMSCRFPSCRDLQSYWSLLHDGRYGITDYPLDRVGGDTSLEGLRAGYVPKAEEFDPLFFGISPLEAETMDPQQRLFLEVTWEALEDAGYAGAALSYSQTGVYVGTTINEYEEWLTDVTPHLGPGNELSLIPNRLSYLFNFMGPSFMVNTACSSALVALDTACRNIELGQCEQAIVGGVNLILADTATRVFQSLGMLAKDAKCKTFDARADGYVRGEGVAAILIKPLDRALADGDRVYAVIKGTALNHDGHSKVGLTAPNPKAQKALLLKAYEQAGVDPSTVSYIEAHGTGTALGDPIEVDALTQAFRKYTDKKQFCAIGSAKTNIGHLEPASGMAGLIKVILCMHHRKLVPSLHFEKPNPSIRFADSPFFVNTELRDWTCEGPRRAGVSAFGWGGANAHVVLEEAPAPAPRATTVERPVHLLTLSARSESALQVLARRYEARLAVDDGTQLADACFTANVGRGLFKHRLAVAGTTATEVRASLAAYAAGTAAPGVVSGEVRGKKRPKIAFVFTGQGAQEAGMAVGLYRTQPTFRRALERCEPGVREVLGVSLLDALYGKDGAALNDTALAQPALFAVGYALAELWRSWGVRPDAVMGHSVGEYVAACVSGALTPEDAVRLVALRGKLMGQLPRDGAMVAVLAPAAAIEADLRGREAELAIAAYNAPEAVVISGRREAVEAVVAACRARGVATQPLAVSHAFHSPLMTPVCDALGAALRQTKFGPLQIPLVSNVTGRVLGAQELTAEYWLKHLLSPVCFQAGVETLVAQGVTVFVEVGPKPVLSGLIRRILPAESPAVVVPSLGGASATGTGEEREWRALCAALAELHVRNAEVTWAGFDRDYPRRRVALPTYPFERKRYWPAGPAGDDGKPTPVRRRAPMRSEAGRASAADAPAPAVAPAAGAAPRARIHPLVEEKIVSPALKTTIFQKRFTIAGDAVLGDHRILEENSAILPAASFLEMTLAAGREVLRTNALVLRDVMVAKPVAPRGDEEAIVQVILEPHGEGGRELAFRIVSSCDGGTTWSDNVSGRIHANEAPAPARIDVEAIKQRCPKRTTGEHLYTSGSYPFDWGPYFRSIQWYQIGDDELVAHLVLPEAAGDGTQFIFHPSISDGAFQAVGTGFCDDLYVPFTFDEVQVFGPLPPRLYAHGRAVRRKNGTKPADIMRTEIVVTDESGQPLVVVKGFCLKRVAPDTMRTALGSEAPALPAATEKAAPARVDATPVNAPEWFHEITWKRSALGQAPARSAGTWVVFADELGVGHALVAELQKTGDRCVTVRKGARFCDRGDAGFTLNPESSEDYQALAAAIAERGIAPTGVVHLWSCSAPGGETGSLESLDESLHDGPYSLLFLVQAMGERFKKERVSYWLVTSYGQVVQAAGQAPVTPEHATLWGLGKVVSIEYSRTRCYGVDLETGGCSSETLAHTIAAEMASAAARPQDDVWVAYRGGQRFEPTVQSVAVATRATLPSPLKDGGVYLITGGQGGIGLEVARFIASRVARPRLALLNRTPLDASAPTERVAAIRRLEAAGAEVTTIAADVADPTRLGAAVEAIRKQWGRIDGVIHAAGIVGDGIIRTKTLDAFQRVVRPKVHGTWALDRALAGERLDFFCLFSSLAALGGNVGQADYCAANSYLDAFVGMPRRHPIHALGWSLWAETGMGVSEEVQAALREAGVRAMRTEPALHAFDAALRTPGGYLVIADFPPETPAKADSKPATSPLDEVAQEMAPMVSSRKSKPVPPEPVAAAAPAPVAAPASAATPEQLVAAVQDYLVAQISEVLKLAREDVDIDANFQELGFDSIMAMTVKRKIEADAQIELKPVLLFEYPTIRELSEYLGEEHADVYARMLTSASGAAPVPAAVPTAPATAAPAAASGSGPDRQALPGLVEEYLVQQVSNVLKLAKEDIDIDANFQELGFDSIMAMTVKRKIETDAQIELKPVLLFEYPTIRELAEFLAEDCADAFAPIVGGKTGSGHKTAAGANGSGVAHVSPADVVPPTASAGGAAESWETGVV